MTEFDEAVWRFAADLHAAGAVGPAAERTVALYREALEGRAPGAWLAFYLGVARALDELAGALLLSEAARPLLAIIDDDYGSAIVPPEVRKRIGEVFVERGRREASLSS